jgi:hypothetical protein
MGMYAHTGVGIPVCGVVPALVIRVLPYGYGHTRVVPGLCM